MTTGRPHFSLSRWSRRKLEAAATAPQPGASPASIAPAPASVPAATSSLELPPVESLTFECDFTAFLRPEVDDKVKRAALKQLFRDPRFNVMDGLDTYIDDYTKADPIAPDVLADLLQRGFGRAADTGQEQAVAVNAPRAIPATTDEAQAAISAGGAPAATPRQPSLSHEQAKRSADEDDAARLGDDEPIGAKPADDSR